MSLKRKAAIIDLTTRAFEIKEIPLELRKKYLGGRGIDAYFLYKLIKPGIDPLGPDNVLLVSAGLLTGTTAPASSRTNIGAKSPLTGLLGSANMGGFFSAELRYAGFDHLIIQGKAEKLSYLWITNDSIEIRDAAHLKGADANETQTLIREELDDEEIKSMTIGIAGENLVSFACVRTGPKNSGGRTGMGAVMGSKNLKAIAVRGTKPIAIADPKGALRYHKELIEYIHTSKYTEIMGKWGTNFIYDVTNSTGLIRTKNFQQNQFPNSEELECEELEKYSLGVAGCFGCTMHCRHKIRLKEGPMKGQYDEGPEYTTLGAFGTEVANNKLHKALEGNYLVNKHGLDILEVGSMIAWAIELNEKGLLPKALLGDLDLSWGNMDAVLKLTEDIAYRRGELADILADGPKQAAARLGEGTLKYNIQVKGMSALQSDERATPSLALGLATSTRGADHLRSRPAIDLYHLPEQALKAIYGKEGLSSDYRDYAGKPWMVTWQERIYAIVDALGICKFQTVFLSPNMPKAEEYSKLIKLITGLEFSPQELMEIGERIYVMERLFNNREGATRKDDYLPDRYYDEPNPAGLKAVRGKYIERDKYEEMLDEYYDLHGWDSQGNPTSDTLERLGIQTEAGSLL
ncbi:MAG: aldehyde ferredoxin oxidoreductase [Gammaproteobacteria bacterium RIFCSPLOWO2_02_FULL_56_15]|nr:MAG: aldehyde ferredoxin oxidoreductase [Gammaproteobacteria bacterium RIFCSPLOWO2_02_FULL_56_15]